MTNDEARALVAPTIPDVALYRTSPNTLQLLAAGQAHEGDELVEGAEAVELLRADGEKMIEGKGQVQPSIMGNSPAFADDGSVIAPSVFAMNDEEIVVVAKSVEQFRKPKPGNNQGQGQGQGNGGGKGKEV